MGPGKGLSEKLLTMPNDQDPISEMLAQYPAPWLIKYLPEEHRPANRFTRTEYSASGMPLRIPREVEYNEPPFDRGPEEEIDQVLDARGQRVPIEGYDSEYGCNTTPDEMLKAIVALVNGAAHAKRILGE